jgi:hypothetical protein
MWWGWAVAISFVLAGIFWHLLTYQQGRPTVKTAGVTDEMIESKLLEHK